DMGLDRPAIDADGILERGAAEHVLAAQHITANDAPRLADAELRRQVDDVGIFEAGHRAQELERLDRLAAAVDLAARHLVRLESVDGGAIPARNLREIYPPLYVVALRAHDRGLARKFVRACGFRLLHQHRDDPPGLARLLRIDAVEAEHHR